MGFLSLLICGKEGSKNSSIINFMIDSISFWKMYKWKLYANFSIIIKYSTTPLKYNIRRSWKTVVVFFFGPKTALLLLLLLLCSSSVFGKFLAYLSWWTLLNLMEFFWHVPRNTCRLTLEVSSAPPTCQLSHDSFEE